MRDSVALDDCGTVGCIVRSQTGFDNAADEEHGSSAASHCAPAVDEKVPELAFDGTVVAAFDTVPKSSLQRPSYKTVQQALFSLYIREGMLSMHAVQCSPLFYLVRSLQSLRNSLQE